MSEMMPWEEHSADNASTTTQETVEMTNSNVNTNAASTEYTGDMDYQAMLSSMLGEISGYPLQNIMQRLMQSMVSEIARARHLADRVEFGDDAVKDLDGVPCAAVFDANSEGPGVDGLQPRQLSEAQLEIVQRTADDEDHIVTALLNLKTFYVTQFNEQPQYSLKQDRTGKWTPIQDFEDAVNHEYTRAHEAWIRKQTRPAQSETDGAQHLVQQRRKAARSKAAGL